MMNQLQDVLTQRSLSTAYIPHQLLNMIGKTAVLFVFLHLTNEMLCHGICVQQKLVHKGANNPRKMVRLNHLSLKMLIWA